MRSDPRALVRRLTPTARRHFEGAVTDAALAQHEALTPEHVLRAMARDENGDVALLLEPEERTRLLDHLERHLARARRAHGRPSLSEALTRWLERAWLVASLEWADDSVRTGALLIAWLEITASAVELPPAIASISLDRVRAARTEALARSPENGELAGRAAAGNEVAPGSALARFTTSFTARARRGELDPVLGREHETRQLVDILCRRRKNNPVLVGEPGVGKTAVVEGLALAIASGGVPESLRDVEILALEMGSLEAGASQRGEIESRLTSIIREVQSSPRPIVLFIDEAHTLVGAQPNGGTDAANLLKPALARGELRTIAATTYREHKKYFEKDAALERRFQKVQVDEPDEATAIAMLRGLVPTYEHAHGVLVRDEAVEAAVTLAKRYVAGRQLPDSCVDVLDTACARVRGARVAPPLSLVRTDAAIAAIEREIAAVERDRRDGHPEVDALPSLRSALATKRGERAEIEARWSAQRETLERLLAARRALAAASDRPEPERRALEIDVRVAREAFEAAAGDAPLVSAEVDARAIASTIEAWTGVPIGDVRRSRTETLCILERELDRRVKGQSQAMRAIADGLRVCDAGLRTREAPAGVFLLVGPSGVGKTETAHAIADLLYGGDRFLTTINLSEYQEKHTVSRLVGSPPGYVGYGEGGKLTEAVRARPHSVVLLDECEKADREVMNTFYRLFDRGVLADGEGRLVDFRSTVLVLTSNLACDRIATLHERGVTDAATIVREIRPVLAAHFAPALLARMSVVPYVPLGDDVLAEIVDLELSRVVERARAAHDVAIEIDAALRERLRIAAKDPAAGVRHLRAAIERDLLAPLALELLGDPARGTRRALRISIDADGRTSFSWSAR